MSEQLLNDLREAIASSQRRPLIICGAGVSVAATDGAAPSWSALIASGIARVESLDPDEEAWATYSRSRLSKNKPSEWIKVADELTERLGGSRNAEFSEWIEHEVGHLDVKSSEILDALKGLGCPIATTNYDNILSSSLGIPAITWEEPEQVHRFLSDKFRAILHLHGHWHKPSTIILGSASYDALEKNEKRKVLLQFASLDRPALYIGCSGDGLSDPDFTHVADFIKEWQQTAPRSYWIVKKSQRYEGKSLSSSDNPRLFPISFGEAYGDLPQFLNSISPNKQSPLIKTSDFPSIEQQEPEPDIFGREEELRALEDALIAERSAIIGGGPGFGKTALAVAALYRQKVKDKFGARRIFVSLESEGEPRAFLASLAAVLGLPSGGDESSLLRQLQLKASEAPLLAILDNAEHVIENSRAESERVLRLAAQIVGLTLVITTRGTVPRLHDSMTIHDLPKLSLDASREAFLDIAGITFESDENLNFLLGDLDGHALSIELVAARAAGGASLESIRRAWQELRGEILKIVGEVESRLTSVRASLALSLQAKLLVQSPFARRLLALLAVLPAGLPQSAISRVLADRGGLSKVKAMEAAIVLQQLKLVERRFDDRLRMLTPLREAARLDLTIMPADKRRLIEFYCKVAQDGCKAGTSQWEAARPNVEIESGNFESIIRLAIGEKIAAEEVYGAVCGIGDFYKMTGQGSTELIEYAATHYKKTEEWVQLGSVYGLMASVLFVREEYEKARINYKKGLDLAIRNNRLRTQANCYAGLGKIEAILGDWGRAEDYINKSLSKFKETGDLIGQANQLNALADLRLSNGNPEAESLYQESLELYRKASDALGIVNASRDLAEYKCENLLETLREAIVSYRRLGVPVSEASAHNRLAFLLQATGQYSEALDELDSASKLARIGANVTIEAVSIILRGVVERRMQNPSWEGTISEGFSLLHTKLRSDDRAREGYGELERYLTAADHKSREIARERTRQAWDKAGRQDEARMWLELDIY